MLNLRRERRWHELAPHEKGDALGSIVPVERRYRNDDGGRGILLALLLVPILVIGLPVLLYKIVDWVGPFELVTPAALTDHGMACLVLAFVAFSVYRQKRRERAAQPMPIAERPASRSGEWALLACGVLLTLYGLNLVTLGPCPWGLGWACGGSPAG